MDMIKIRKSFERFLDLLNEALRGTYHDELSQFYSIPLTIYMGDDIVRINTIDERKETLDIIRQQHVAMNIVVRRPVILSLEVASENRLRCVVRWEVSSDGSNWNTLRDAIYFAKIHDDQVRIELMQIYAIEGPKVKKATQPIDKMSNEATNTSVSR